jgi:circadian clock protein KaiB
VSARRRQVAAKAAPDNSVLQMRLYVAGNAPNSLRAIANLAAICEEHLQHGYSLEVIDVLEHPLRALADGVLVTPSLTKLGPGPCTNVIGNLSDTSRVLLALGLNGATS